MPDTITRDEPQNLDEAIKLFRDYCDGKNDFDELDFKEWLIDRWLTKRFVERGHAKHGWNARGEMV